jgi:glycosyltransferase involved in cell wall biosynthesis
MCSQAHLAVVYASADLLLFPSLTETFGNVTLESLASGTPVLAFDCAAASELVQDTQNGWLVAGDDAQRYVLKALSITQNKKLLSDIRPYAHASIAHWSWLAIASQVEVILRKAIAENPSA